MAKSPIVKPTHKAIKQYYQALQSYSDQGVSHEGATETAFSRLLADVAHMHHCSLIPKLKYRVGSKNIYPDGTIKDALFATRRGFWEAKDTSDDLDKEISKKIEKGYPLVNTIFEDTRRAVLFQGGQEHYRFDLTNKQQLADLFNEFFAYSEPEIENFHQAVEEFKTRVPDLAKGLLEKLTEAHKGNKKFQAAFESFFTICQQTLNPNISRAAVDEMLVQHLLTERLIRKIFDNPEFIHRNVIAAEIEKVIDALVSLSFNRDQFLKSLDKFYRAIEDAAKTMPEFNDKQHFLNTVYEQFFQGYSVKVADTHGIVYTPQEIVDFMCASVEEVLKTEFNLTLGSKGVNILDPCTGTGNFIVNLINRVPKKDLPRVYKEQLFANEVMLLPYYIAALNIEHAYWEKTGQYDAFEGLCYVDTLELTEADVTQPLFEYMNEENTARVARQKTTPITVVIGNPPYNIGQLSENDNNKNRAYDVIDNRVKETYARDSNATLKMQLYDPYVKFFRWAIDRLGNRDGIVCFVTNNSFVDQTPFDGMRKHLLQDFSRIYHLDLHGNVRKNPKLSGTTHNVFGIQVGVGVTVAIRNRAHNKSQLFYHRVPESWRKEEKLAWLAQSQDCVRCRELVEISLGSSTSWVASKHAGEFESFCALNAKAPATGFDHDGIFQVAFPGVETNRDDIVHDFDRSILESRIEELAENYNIEVDRFKRKVKDQHLDDFLDYSKVRWSSTLKIHMQRGTYAAFDKGRIRDCLYRPFCKKSLYYDDVLVERPGMFRKVFPIAQTEFENQVIQCTNHIQIPFAVHIARWICNRAVCGRAGTCVPFFVYDEDGGRRRENITDRALQQFRTHYGDDTIGKWEIFHYVYGILHHPRYRTRFADNLKRELPRIPLAPPVAGGDVRAGSVSDDGGVAEAGESSLTLPARKSSGFWAFAAAGKALAKLHLDYETLEPYSLKWVETEGVPLSYKVEDKMRLSKDKTALRVNPSLTLAGIPPETFNYRLGNRSALDWVIDQYQISEDKRSGTRSDPNRAEDEEYIVRLVGQVVRVSVETIKIVAELPAEFTQ